MCPLTVLSSKYLESFIILLVDKFVVIQKFTIEIKNKFKNS